MTGDSFKDSKQLKTIPEELLPLRRSNQKNSITRKMTMDLDTSKRGYARLGNKNIKKKFNKLGQSQNVKN